MLTGLVKYGSGPIPIDASCLWMNIHLPAILMFTRVLNGLDRNMYWKPEVNSRVVCQLAAYGWAACKRHSAVQNCLNYRNLDLSGEGGTHSSGSENNETNVKSTSFGELVFADKHGQTHMYWYYLVLMVLYIMRKRQKHKIVNHHPIHPTPCINGVYQHGVQSGVQAIPGLRSVWSNARWLPILGLDELESYCSVNEFGAYLEAVMTAAKQSLVPKIRFYHVLFISNHTKTTKQVNFVNSD